MANLKSALITGRDDKEKQAARGLQSVERVAVAKITSAGAIADNDILALAEIPVNARITSIRMWSDDMGTGGLLNLGFYPGNKAVADLTDALAVDEDAIGTAIDVKTAATNDVEVRFETLNIDTIEKTAWELAGLSAAPAYGTFILAFTASEATTAAGDIVTVIRYTE